MGEYIDFSLRWYILSGHMNARVEIARILKGFGIKKRSQFRLLPLRQERIAAEQSLRDGQLDISIGVRNSRKGGVDKYTEKLLREAPFPIKGGRSGKFHRKK